MRLTFNENDIKLLSLAVLKTYGDEHLLYINLSNQIKDNKNRDISKKAISAKNATKARQKKAKEKIENAINLLRLENEKISYYSIAKKAEVSYNTVKKYICI